MIDTLIQKIKEMENPTVVGLDPRLSMVPAHIREQAYETHGKTLQGVAAAFLAFNRAIIDAVYDLVPAVKPQIAMYEMYGAPGVQAFIDTVAYAKSKGLIVIGDVKRNDIASTAQAYSDGHLGEVEIEGSAAVPFDEDFITVNPYLGTDSIEPYFAQMKARNRGLFVLVKTSNPGSGEIQDLIMQQTGAPLYETVGQLVAQWGEPFIGQCGFSDIGAVVGATHPEQGKRLRKLLPHVFFLVPGYGAQGGSAQDLAGCFNQDGIGAIVNSSRGIIAAYQNARYQKQFTPEEFAQASRQAVLDMKADINSVL